jgi:6-pyruvoyltetrahydropterin/6-carboxytetrahydropterin synthase
MHGHTYRLQVTLGMPTCRFDDKVGMVVDFSVLSDVVRTKIIDRVDHKVLNEVLDYAPTAENMALNFGLEMLPLVGALVGPVYLDSIRLWETPNSFAEYITEASPCRNCDCQ